MLYFNGEAILGMIEGCAIVRISIYKLIVKEKGQAITEVALIMPCLFVLLLGAIQVGIIFSGQTAVINAACDGVRIAAMGANDEEVNSVVQDRLKASPFLENITSIVTPIGVRPFGKEVTVQVNATIKVLVPFFNLLFGEHYQYSSTSVSRVESLKGGI